MCDICGKGFFAAGALKVIYGFYNITLDIYVCKQLHDFKVSWKVSIQKSYVGRHFYWLINLLTSIY